jgi:hypothetical protein
MPVMFGSNFGGIRNPVMSGAEMRIIDCIPENTLGKAINARDRALHIGHELRVH